MNAIPAGEGMTMLPRDENLALQAGMGLVPSALPMEEALGALADTLNGSSQAAAPIATDAARQLTDVLKGAKHPRREEIVARWRGILALCLLADAWPEIQELSVVTVRAQQSSFASALMQDTPWALPGANLIMLASAGGSKALGLASEETGIIPVAEDGIWSTLLPSRVDWYDREKKRWLDPAPLLHETDRTLLLRRLECLGKHVSPAVSQFAADLMREGLRPARELARQDEDALRALTVRLKAVVGLSAERQFGALTCREASYREHAAGNPLLACLGCSDTGGEALGNSREWLWKGVPFARSGSAAGFESTGHPEEGAALTELAREIALLETYSARWNRDLAQRLAAFLTEKRESRGFSPVVVSAAEGMIRRAGQLAEESQAARLMWPWDQSPAAAALLCEALGEQWLSAASMPFSDKLCLIPEDARVSLGDETLSRVCRLPALEEEPACLALPPLSPALAERMDTPERLETLLPDSFAFRRLEEGAVEASFALRGRETVILSRIYRREDIVFLPAEEVPVVAVWPCVPLPKNAWKAYYVYRQGGALRLDVLRDGGWTATEDRLFSVVQTSSFPTVAALWRGDACVGVLPHFARVISPRRSEAALAALDLGASGLSLALRQGGKEEPMRLPGLVQILLRGSKAPRLAENFVTNRPVGPVLPAVAELFNDAPDPLPLTDGHILFPESAATLAEKPGAGICCSLKWSMDKEDQRARRMALRQAMTFASLAAVYAGAPRISWRVALSAAMAGEGRAQLWHEICVLAPLVARDTGLPLAYDAPPVTHADESAALGAYFRGRGVVRGGFLAMDIGAEHALLALWLRGMNRPAAVCCLPLGVRPMLIDGLLHAPERLAEDFADMPDPAVRDCVARLAAQLTYAPTRRRELEKARALLDCCLGEHLPAIAAHMNARYAAGQMTGAHALALGGFAMIMAVAGMLLEQVWRDPLLNDYLPAELTLCLTGRGSLLLLNQAETVQARLTRLLRMMTGADHPVRSLRWQSSAEPGTEAVMGLCAMTETDAEKPGDGFRVSAKAQPGWTLPVMAERFMAAFRTEFPDAFGKLYPGMAEPYGGLSREARAMAEAAAARYGTAAEPMEALTASLLSWRSL